MFIEAPHNPLDMNGPWNNHFGWEFHSKPFYLLLCREINASDPFQIRRKCYSLQHLEQRLCLSGQLCHWEKRYKYNTDLVLNKNHCGAIQKNPVLSPEWLEYELGWWTILSKLVTSSQSSFVTSGVVHQFYNNNVLLEITNVIRLHPASCNLFTS